MTITGKVLERIVAATRVSLAQRMARRTMSEVESLARGASPARDFAAALREKRNTGIAIIAEVKRASPSKGWLNQALDAPALAVSYQSGGASAVSVLTEKDFFHGGFSDLEQVREAVLLPVLCKDFIVEPYQVCEARWHGADAVLLIAEILDSGSLRELGQTAAGLGMAALVETHNEAEVLKALASGARIIGINNRDLADFTVDLKTTIRLRPLVPTGVVVVSESGIKNRGDVASMERANVDAILVGEMLVKSPDPAAQIRGLLGAL